MKSLFRAESTAATGYGVNSNNMQSEMAAFFFNFNFAY